MTQRKGGSRTVRGKFYARVRIGEGRRPSIPLTGCATEAEATARAADIADMAQVLIDAGRWFDIEELAEKIGAAKTDKDVRVLKLAAVKRAGSMTAPLTGGETFAQFAERWTNGALATLYPDHVRAKQTRGDVGILTRVVNPILGPIPLVAITLEDADNVMRTLESPSGSAYRRHVAQVIHRVLRLAAFPAKIIKLSPLPPGWLPKLGKAKAKAYLYPDEDRKLLAAPADKVALVRRLLYGFLAREGMRLSEALLLAWEDIDLERGAVRLDENKTDEPRAWALGADVVATLTWWKANGAPGRGPFAGLTANHAADLLRKDLAAAGVTRAELFDGTDRRRKIRAHDLRATFITVSLANGRTEAWVQDRTGHTSTLMIARYRRAARTVAELGLGTLLPLDRAIPEIPGGAQVGQRKTRRAGKKDAKKP